MIYTDVYDIRYTDKYANIKNYCKARDHCHNVGEYRGAAHCTCNFKYSEPGEITIVFFTMDQTSITILSQMS